MYNDIMSSFEEVLVNAQRDHEFTILQEAISELVNVSDHYRLSQRIQPFLPYINDGGSLQALDIYLQNTFQQNQHTLDVLVHNVIVAAKRDSNLKKALEALVGFNQ